MLNWLGRALGLNSISLPVGVPKSWVDSVQARLVPLSKKDGVPAGLARDMMSFVISGEPYSVLHDVAQCPVVAEHLLLTGRHWVAHEPAETTLYDGFEQLPVSLALRWARLLEASLPVGFAQWTQTYPNAVHWPEALLMHAAGHSLDVWSSQVPKVRGLTMPCLEDMLEEAGLPVSAVVTAAFVTDAKRYSYDTNRAMMVATLDGFSAAVERHADVVRPLLLTEAVDQRLHALALLDKASSKALSDLAQELSELATSSSKQVRAAAQLLLVRIGMSSVPSLQALAITAKPEQRLHALRLLAQLADSANDEELRAYAHSTAEADKAASVRALLEEWSQMELSETKPVRYEYELPLLDWSGQLTPDVAKLLAKLWEEADAAIDQANVQARKHHEQSKAAGYNWPLRITPTLERSDLERLKDYIASPQAVLSGTEFKASIGNLLLPILRHLAAAPACTPIVLLKVLVFFGLDQSHNQNNRGLGDFLPGLVNALQRSSGRPSLLELQQMLEVLGHPAEEVLSAYCNHWGDPLARDWPDEQVWPFFAHHVDLLCQTLLSSQNQGYGFDRGGLYQALGTLPQPPAMVVNALFDLALGTAKSERPAAQQALANLPDKEIRIIAALTSGKAEVRALAAQWLGRLRYAPAQTALESAVGKEKNDVAKGAMLDALQMLGQPVDKYLNRQALAGEAGKSLAKGLPKDLDWFPWSSLPSVRWADSGELVPVEVLQWFVAQAIKQKSPEPNAVLRKYCEMFVPRDREQFGQFVLEAWLSGDVRPISAEAALQIARNNAQSIHAYMQRFPQHYQGNPDYGRTVEELTAAYLPAFLRQPAGSAIASKGVLAVAAACAAERAAAPVGRYLKEYYGTRAAQGKALIAMLAWIEHPNATQLMLSVGNRFRTKSFQEEATRQAEALAERKGWTLAELADRTMPSAGFDETGCLELSYGVRCFSARLLADFKVELFNPEGKKIAALPEPRQDDDADQAKDAKKAYSAAKKEIKNIVNLQTERLYEALCTERGWIFEDWDQYLNRHPIVRRLVQRLIWAEVEEGSVVRAFRPLDDGTLSDADDNEITLSAGAQVRIAHDSLLSAEQIEQWQHHLADYQITPIFQQLGKGTFSLPVERSKDTEIKDFEGQLIETFALRGRALKLGYTRGSTEDGGWFFSYEKRFPTLGLQAVIQFTGNGLPEENRTVALLSLSFAASTGQALLLGKVPKVLLSECFNDLRLIAADGSGFDPDWQKKSEY